MSTLDLSLLPALDALLTEGSVARAAARLGLSPSATSRALSRLREATGDPLLVRAGRGLVPTPRAMELRDRVGSLLAEAEAVLRPAEGLDLARLARAFTIRAREGLVEGFGAALIARARREAPGVRLDFVARTGRDSVALREGAADLEIGVAGKATGPEVRARTLFRDRFVGVVRQGHPLAQGEITAERYAAGEHVVVSRRGLARGPVDEALRPLGLERRVATLVAGFTAAIALARGSDLVATVPERHTGALREGMHTFALPVAVPALSIAMLWHPRMDADPAHRWLRGLVRQVCGGGA